MLVALVARAALALTLRRGWVSSTPLWRSCILCRALMLAALRVPALVCVAFTAAAALFFVVASRFLLALSSIHTLALFLFSLLSETSFATSFAVRFRPPSPSHVLGLPLVKSMIPSSSLGWDTARGWETARGPVPRGRSNPESSREGREGRAEQATLGSSG